MITFQLSDKPLSSEKSTCFGFLFTQDYVLNKTFKEFAQQYDPNLENALEASGFTGKALEIRVLPVMQKKHFIYPIFIGLGKKEGKHIPVERLRRAIALLIKKAIAQKQESIALLVPDAKLFGVTAEYLAKEITSIAVIASYHFDEYITEQSRKETKIASMTLLVDSKEKKEVEKGIAQGTIIAHAVNKARHWIDLPPTWLTPPDLADKAKEIAKNKDLKITVFNEKEINKMGMGGLAAVSRGSDLDCCLLIMEYKTKKKEAPTIALVGKGITFDSGGLSLKPAQHMETMKEDMSGAAAVIVAMEALAQLKPDINVIGIAPLAENMPSGKATKPGDIVRFYNGKTAEIRNTDAEGRLILGDALSYAVKHYKPDAIIDVATLTGACAYALGPFFTGLMSQSEDLVERILKAGQTSGDRVWRLPMDEDYKPAIRSEVADLSNTGNQKYMAGAITAAHFLQNFVDDIPWAHLDIAGTAFDVPDIPYYRAGATGAGVRLLIDLAMNWEK